MTDSIIEVIKNLEELQFTTMDDAALGSTFTKIVNDMGDYVQVFNKLDDIKNKILDVLRARGSVEIDEKDIKQPDIDADFNIPKKKSSKKASKKVSKKKAVEEEVEEDDEPDEPDEEEEVVEEVKVAPKKKKAAKKVKAPEPEPDEEEEEEVVKVAPKKKKATKITKAKK